MKKSTRRFLNLMKITLYSLAGYNGNHEIYYKVEPFNLSVLSNDTIKQKINSVLNSIKALGDLELVCMNSKENFENNKVFYGDRIEEETNEVIRNLLIRDRDMLDELQVNSATARLFLICIRVKEEKGIMIESFLNQVEKVLSGNGLSVKLLDRHDIKSMLAVYFTQNIVTTHFSDVEGVEWYDMV